MYLKAPDFIEIKNPIFLAGPIQGTIFNWQDDAAYYISTKNNNIGVISPRRNMIGNDSFNYYEQVNWETKYLNLAAKEGVILFWLKAEEEHDSSRAYAQTTRFELAEWYTKAPDKIVVGIESGFSGERYIRKRLNIPIYDSLKETCDRAIEKIISK